MYIKPNKRILSTLSWFLFFGIFFFWPPGQAEAAVSRISAAKGIGFANQAQKWRNKYVKQTYTQKYRHQKEVVGYYAKDWAQDNQSDNSLKANSQSITGVATFSYKVNSSGQIIGQTPKKALATALDNNIETLALIHNFSSGAFDRNLIHSVLTNPGIRAETVTNIYKTLIKYGYDGVNIDFENIPPEDRRALNDFMTELKDKLGPRGMKVTISVPAKTKDDPGNGWSGAFDYQHLADTADRVMLMTYDEHWLGGAPGPVASQPWVEKVVRYSAGVIPGEKTLLGLGTYGYDWIVGRKGYRAVPAKDALTLAQQYGASIQWDNYSQTPYFYYWRNSQKHVVWFESTQSASFKLDLVNRYDLRGIAIWRLGFEPPGFWDMVNRKLNDS